MSLKEEISQAIQKNLPSAVAQELRSYLEQAEKDKETIDRNKKKIEELERQLKETAVAKESLERRVSAAELLDKRKLELDDRERALGLELARAAQAAAEAKCGAIMELARVVFKNPTLTYSTMGSKSEAAPPGTSSYYPSTYSLPFNSTTSIDQEKS